MKSRSRHCEFGTLKESLIGDRIVAGIQDAKVRERLLGETDLILDKAISIFRASETTKKQVEEMATSPVVDNVDSINNFQRRESRDSRNPTTQRPRQDRPEMTRNNDQSRACKYCENMHQRERFLHMAECVINVESGTILPQFVSLNQSATLNKNNPQVMKELNFS